MSKPEDADKTPTESRVMDEFWMNLALKEAFRAQTRGEVPVGAVLVHKNELVSAGGNRRETWATPIAHAEIIAIQRASKKLQAWRLLDCTLYVTLEPCVMCAGALVQSRISRLVYGATDPKGGGIASLYQIGNDTRLNHQFKVTAGVLAEPCSFLLKNFFQERRKQR